MRWIVHYQKGSFFLRESYALRDEATARLNVLKEDESVWSVEVRDSVTGQFRVIPRLPLRTGTIRSTAPERNSYVVGNLKTPETTCLLPAQVARLKAEEVQAPKPKDTRDFHEFPLGDK